MNKKQQYDNEDILKEIERIIIKIEKNVIGETINKICNIENQNENFLFEIQFENFHSENTKIISEQELIEFDKTREFSLLKSNLVPQKTLYSYISQNVIKKILKKIKNLNF